jgi:multiple sugar transport system permease protein
VVQHGGERLGTVQRSHEIHEVRGGAVYQQVVQHADPAGNVAQLEAPTEVSSNLNILPEELTWANYPDGWFYLDGISFGTFFMNSTLIAGATVVANAASCLLAAYAFARLRFRFRRGWFAIMIGTLLLPSHVLIVPQYVMFNYFGWVDTPLPLVIPKLLATEAFFVS